MELIYGWLLIEYNPPVCGVEQTIREATRDIVKHRGTTGSSAPPKNIHPIKPNPITVFFLLNHADIRYHVRPSPPVYSSRAPTPCYRPSPSTFTTTPFPPNRGTGHFFFFFFLSPPFPFPPPPPSSVYCCFGAGHGRMCGAPTTRNASTAVEVNRDAVVNDFGCSAGGIVW